MANGYPINGFESPEHSMVAGMIWGISEMHGVKLRPVADAAGYTNRFEVLDADFSPLKVRVFVTVEPPEPIPE